MSAGSEVKLGQPVAIVGTAGEDISALLDRLGSPAVVAPRLSGKLDGGREVPPSSTTGSAPEVVTARGSGSPQENAATAPTDTLPPPAVRNPPVVNILGRTAHWPSPSPASTVPEGTAFLPLPTFEDLRASAGSSFSVRWELARGDASLPGISTDFARHRPRHLSPRHRLPRKPWHPPTEAAAQNRTNCAPFSPMRRTIARRLVESKTTIPHFYLSVDVDAAPLVALREQINGDLASTPSPDKGDALPRTKVSVNDLLIKACAVALTRVPECNASFTPEAIRVHKRIDISVAVAIADGLVTPVIRRADTKTLVSIATEVRELAARARARKLTPEEMQDGTFSITNLGMFGIDAFSAVINPPEGAILAVGAVRDVPVIADGVIAPGKRLHLTLSCDHRVVDGAVGAAFLSELRHLIEHPLRTLAG